MLDETAALLEISGGDPFRIRSYRRAAESVEQQTQPLAAMVDEPKRLLEIPGIGKGMAANIVALVKTGTMELREELLKTYKPTMLDLLKLPGMGPKSVALVWTNAGHRGCGRSGDGGEGGQADHAAALRREAGGEAAEGDRGLSQEREPIPHRRRGRGGCADRGADPEVPGNRDSDASGFSAAKRASETVGDLDLLVTGPACEPEVVSAAVEHVASLPLIANLMAKGQKSRWRLRCAMACRWMCGCCRRRAMVRRCSTSRGRRCTASRAGARQRALEAGLRSLQRVRDHGERGG